MSRTAHIILATTLFCALPGYRLQGQQPAPIIRAEQPPAQTATADTGCCGPITPDGQHVLQVLVGMDVEHLWQSNTKIH